jgi:integrase
MGKHGAGSIINRKGTDLLYIRYYHDGKQIQEATGTASREEAQRLLNIRLGNDAQGAPSPADSNKLTYKNIREAYIADDSSREEYDGLKHIDAFFGGRLVCKIDSDTIRAFIAARRREGISDPTIRRNLTPLRAMFRLAAKEKKFGLRDVPYFPMPKDSTPTGKYIEPETFDKILSALPTAASTKQWNKTHGARRGERTFHDLRPFFTFMYCTGCRLGAAQKIRWEHVSKDCRVLTLPADITKNKEELTLVLDGALLEPIAADLRKRFRRDGEPIFDSTNYRPEWARACAKAGLRGWNEEKRTREDKPGGRIHDCRCSGAINLIDAGVDEGLVLQIGGWKTRKMLDRYNRPNVNRVGAALTKAGKYVADRIAAAK